VTAILSDNAWGKVMIPKLRRWSWLMLVLLALGVALGWGWGSVWQMAPLQAQTNAPPVELAPALPMVSGTFQDGGDRFEIGILDGFEVSSVGSAPLFQAPDGSLAYTVVVAPAEPEASDATLLRLANEAFGQGEGFTPAGQQALPGGGLQILWTGQLTQGNGPPQPISGQIFAKQRDTDVFLLMVAATAGQADQVGDAIATLGSTLTVP
jgi:hypothetical protein